MVDPLPVARKRTPAAAQSDDVRAMKLVEWAEKRGIALAQVTVGSVLLVIGSMGPRSSLPPARARRGAPGHRHREPAAAATEDEARTSLYREMGGEAFSELERLGMIEGGGADEDDDEDEPTVNADG